MPTTQVGQIFIGRLNKRTRTKDLEDRFAPYGRITRCDIKYGNGNDMAYAFVDYDDRRDADDAIRAENGRELNGYRIVVEWTRSSKKTSGYDSRDRREYRRSPRRERRRKSRSRSHSRGRSYSR